MDTTTHYAGTPRVTKTGPSHIPDVTVQIVGDQDADGCVVSASIYVSGDSFLMPDEAEAHAADIIATAREYRERGLKP